MKAIERIIQEMRGMIDSPYVSHEGVSYSQVDDWADKLTEALGELRALSGKWHDDVSLLLKSDDDCIQHIGLAHFNDANELEKIIGCEGLDDPAAT